MGSWFKVDSGFHKHRKVRNASAQALGFWVVGATWAADLETDGFLTDAEAESLLGQLRLTLDDVASLFVPPPGYTVGLVERRDGGYQFHDFLAYNPSHAQLNDKRVKGAARQGEYIEHLRQAASTASPDVTEGTGDDTPGAFPLPQSPYKKEGHNITDTVSDRTIPVSGIRTPVSEFREPSISAPETDDERGQTNGHAPSTETVDEWLQVFRHKWRWRPDDRQQEGHARNTILKLIRAGWVISAIPAVADAVEKSRFGPYLTPFSLWEYATLSDGDDGSPLPAPEPEPTEEEQAAIEQRHAELRHEQRLRTDKAYRELYELKALREQAQASRAQPAVVDDSTFRADVDAIRATLAPKPRT